MKKMSKLQKAVAVALAGSALGATALPANAQNTYYVPNTTIGVGAPTVGALPASYTVAGTVPIFAWDGHNNTPGGLGYGWGHNAHWVVFNLTSATALDIKMTDTTTGGNAGNFNSAFTLWSTAGYTDPGGVSGSGHSFSQVSTASASGWLTNAAEGGVTGFIGYANSGPTGWNNANGEAVGAGGGGSFTVGGHNAELVTGVLAPGQYLMALGGSLACGSFAGNNLASCGSLTGSGSYSLTISQVPIPAAVWLLGSALAGMGVIGRRKDRAAIA